MSVGYSTRVGYGFQVSRKKLNALAENGKLEEFQENDFAVAVDSWDPDTSIYFFGILTGGIEPGQMLMVPVKRDYKHQEFLDMMATYRKFFPDENSYMPHEYVLACVD